MKWIALLLALVIPSTAFAETVKVYTPKAGSAERKEFLDAIRSSPDAKYTITTLRMAKTRKGKIAYLQASTQYLDGSSELYVSTGNGKWREIWGIGGGGSKPCREIADHYRSAARDIKSYGIAPEALMPGINKEIATLSREAPEIHCVGDF